MCRGSLECTTLGLVALAVLKLLFAVVAEFGEVLDPIVAPELFALVVEGVLITAFGLVVVDFMVAFASSLLPQPFTSLCLCRQNQHKLPHIPREVENVL